MNEAFKLRLEQVARHLDADLDDLLDWYDSDVDVVLNLEVDDLVLVVKDYLYNRDFYRNGLRP